MNDNKKGKYGAIAEKAMREAGRLALKTHQKMGVPAVFMRNGKIVYLMPDGRVVDNPSSRKTTKK